MELDGGTQHDPALKALIFDIAHTCADLSEQSVRKVFEYIQDMAVLDYLEREQKDRQVERKFRLIYGKRDNTHTHTERERERGLLTQ